MSDPEAAARREIRATPSLALILFDGALLTSFGAFIDIAEAAKFYVNKQYGAIDLLKEENFAVLNVTVLGCGTNMVRLSSGSAWATDDVVGGDYVYDMIVLAGFGAIQQADQQFPLTPDDDVLREWLKAQYARGAYLAASGAACFALADTGLLNGRRATTSWWLQRQFHERYPGVKIDADNAITEDGRLFCSSGIAADQALALRIIERVVAGNLSGYLSRMLGIDRAPLNAAAQVLTASHFEPDQLVSRAEHWLQQRYSRPVRINDLAQAMAVSRRTLIRHFSSALGMTPIDYLHRLRIADAKLLLERSTFNVGRIASLVGYSDVNYFKKLFVENVGIAPKSYRAESRKRLPIGGAGQDPL